VSRFQVGDRVRCQDFKHRSDCFIEIVVSAILPGVHQYCGKVVRDVHAGVDLNDESSRLGLMGRVFMEGAMRRDWDGRLEAVP
jgi:hypothetical protein